MSAQPKLSRRHTPLTAKPTPRQTERTTRVPKALSGKPTPPAPVYDFVGIAG